MPTSRILIPASGPDDWKMFLAEPDKHWKTGYSAKALAHCWHDADGIPSEIMNCLKTVPEFRGLEMLFAIPEHQVPLPGGSRPSQNDIWVLARSESGLVSIAVEGKVSESFGPTLDEWKPDSSDGKRERFKYLCSLLGFTEDPPGDIRYQLLHRTASAIIEAKRFHAKYAVMLVHSFSQTDEWFEDYERFLSLFGVAAVKNGIVSAGAVSDVTLYFMWIRGDKRFLHV